MVFSQTLFNLDDFKNKTKTKLFQSARDQLYKEINNKSYGFLKDLFNIDLKEVYELKKKIEKFDNVLFLGTGGSSLGGKTLVSIKTNFFKQTNKPRIFFLENIDIVSIEGLLEKIDLERTSIVVTSKSGETLETLAQFFFLKKKIEKLKDYKDKFFVITEDKKSTLKRIQEEEGFKFIKHNEKVGGRYSVFTIVGLLPASLSCFDIESFILGAKDFIRKIEDEKYFNSLFVSSLSMIMLERKGFNISVFMPYIDNLNNLSFWYRQLWAESVGKNNNAITPMNSLGTVDQHSQLQLYLDGPKNKFFNLIGRKYSDNYEALDCRFGLNEKVQTLHKKSLELLLKCEMDATLETLVKNKLPVRFIELEKVDEVVIGGLMMYFFIETIFSCYLMNVNPFDQPAVEYGKKLTKQKLKNYEN